MTKISTLVQTYPTGDFNMKEAHAKIQNKIKDFDKNTLNDSSDYIRNQHFIEGRYKSEYQ